VRQGIGQSHPRTAARDIEERFDDVERRFTSIDKRFDDVKWYIGGVAGFFTISFAVLTIVLNQSNTSEKQSLRDFQRQLREDLGKSEGIPQVELFGINRQPLDGQEILGTFRTKNDGVQLVITHFLKNSGTGTTGPISVKIYAPAPVHLDSQSTDETGYDYETYITPKNLEPNEAPGGLTSEWTLNLDLPFGAPPPGKYRMLIKVYYGKGE
jgi:hypothetical protein